MVEYIEKLAEYPYLKMYSQVLIAALNLDFFSNLKDFKNSSQIAKIMGLHEVNTEYFLNALYSLNFITKKDDKYKNTENTSKYLIKDSPYYAGNVLRVFSEVNDFSNWNIIDLVKNGPNENFQNENNMSFDKFYKELKDSQTGIRQVEILDIIKNLEEYAKIKHILDLGCGAGLLGLSIAKSRDDINATLFDMPMMENLIKESVYENELINRTKIKLGDYMNDDIGANYDLVIAVNTLNFAKNNMKLIIEKIYNSLNDDGVFVAILDEVKSDFSNPKEIVVSWLPYAFNGIDMYLVEDYVKDIALDVGFKEFKVEKRVLASGPMSINIFKK